MEPTWAETEEAQRKCLMGKGFLINIWISFFFKNHIKMPKPRHKNSKWISGDEHRWHNKTSRDSNIIVKSCKRPSLSQGSECLTVLCFPKTRTCDFSLDVKIGSLSGRGDSWDWADVVYCTRAHTLTCTCGLLLDRLQGFQPKYPRNLRAPWNKVEEWM